MTQDSIEINQFGAVKGLGSLPTGLNVDTIEIQLKDWNLTNILPFLNFIFLQISPFCPQNVSWSTIKKHYHWPQLTMSIIIDHS